MKKERVKKLSELARLELSEEELEQFAEELGGILEYVNKLNELDTDKVEPAAHIMEQRNVLREDEVKKSLERDEILKNAPEKKDGQFVVPKIMDNE